MAKRTFKNTTTPLSVFARNGNNGWIESAKENQHFNTYDDYIAAVANDKGYSDSEKAYVYNDNFVKDVTKGEKPQGDQAYVNYSHNHDDRTLKGDTKKGKEYDDSELAKNIDTYGINDTTVTSKDVNKFFKDSQSFFEKQQEKAGSTSWENASENYSQFDKKYNKLKKKAYDVSHFLSQNKDNMKEKDYQEAIDYIHSVRKNGKALADAYKSAETYYSQFDSAKEARKAEMGWGANTSESNMTKDKIAKRQDYYNQTQSAIRELDAKIAQKEQIVNASQASQKNQAATYAMYNYDESNSMTIALHDLATLKAERDNLVRESQSYERNQKQFDDNQTILNSKEYQKSLKSYNIDSSNDKLNTYLRNKNHIGSALENQRNGIASSEDLALIEGNQSGWDMLTESEIQTYNSILSAQGEDAAYKWLDDMKNIIDQRITQSVVDDYSNGSGLEKVITNLGTVPMSVVGGIGSAVSDVYNLANGNDITPYDSMHFAQNLTTGIRSETSEEIDKLTGGAKAPISGMTLGGAYQAVMSGLDSLAGASMFGTGYTGLMSMGAFSSTAKDLYERGASNEQIAWGSMLAGAAEYVFEKVSIENFLKTTDTRSKLAIMKQILKQGGVEASEEFATELANIVSDYFVMGDGSNFSEWISDGGLKHAFAQAGLQAIEAAEGGFLSGAGMAGLGSTGNYHSYNSQMTQVGKDFFPTAYGLLDSETGIEGLDTTRASKAMESIKSGKNSKKNFRELGKLVNSAEEILREKATKESIKAQLSAERNQSGDETEVTDSDVDKVYKQLKNNAEWSRSDKLTRQRVEQFRSERTGEVNRKVQEALAEIASNSAKKIAKDETVESVTNSIADKVNEESGHNIEEVLSTSRVDNKTVLNMKDDNGNTVKSGEIEYANRKQAVMIETLAKMEVSAKTANDIIQYMNALPSDLSEQDFSKEMLGIREAYIYGRYGQKYETIESKGFLNDVSDNTRKMFYNRGSVDSMERYSGNKKQYVKSYGGVKFVGNLENNQGKLTAEQNYQIGAVRNIAKHITKNNIVFYESVVNENGERVLDVDLPFRAKGKTAPNGAFTANDGTIYLDVNAGENGEALIMHTFSHEVTHFAAEYSDKFEKLKNFVVNEIVGNGQDFNDLVNRKIMQSADEDGNPTLTFATAQEEVIADAMQSMLTNTDAMEKMLALKKVDYDTFGKIKEIFTKLYNKIKELYKSVNPQTYEGRMILEMKESLDKISELFAEAVVDAGNEYEKLAEMNTGETDIDGYDNTHLYSIRSFSEGCGLYFDYDEKTGTYSIKNSKNGKPVKKVTSDMVANSPLGKMVEYGYKNGNISHDEMNKQHEFLAELMTMCLENGEFDTTWEIAGTLVFSAIKSNSDAQYGKTIDFSTICKKTQQIINVVSSVQVKLGRGLTKDEIKNIVYEETGKSGEPTPCPVCYVFSRWMGIGGILDSMSKFQDKYSGMSESEILKAIKDVEDSVTEFAYKKNRNGSLVKDNFYADGSVKFGGVIAKMKSKLNSQVNSGKKAIQIREVKIEKVRKLEGELDNLLKKYEDKPTNSVQKSIEKKRVSIQKAKNGIPKLETIEKKINDAQAELDRIEEYQWVIRTVMMDDFDENGKRIGYKKDPNYRPVDKEILFDLNRGSEFATQYPKSWKYRTTKGCNAGKAILPYSDARVGEVVQGIGYSNVKDIKIGDSNPFLNGDTFASDSMVEKAIRKQNAQNLIGGMRYQSTSDFRFEYGSDYLISFIEMQAIGAKVQLYTKVIESVDFLCSVGADVNLSVMPLDNGYDENGNLIYSDITGINADAAISMTHKYDNAQLILVGINDRHIKLALEGDDVSFVIPFHGSGNTTKVIQELMNLIGENLDLSIAQDYSLVQSDHFAKNRTQKQKDLWALRKKIITRTSNTSAGESKAWDGSLTSKETSLLESSQILKDLYRRFFLDENADEHGVALSNSQADHIFPYEYWDKSLSYDEADKNGEIFKAYCAEFGIVPRFSGISSDGKKLSYGDFSNDKGYWKLLIDRRMYNRDGIYHEQAKINVTNLKAESLSPGYASKTYGDVMQKDTNPIKTEGIANNVIRRIEGQPMYSDRDSDGSKLSKNQQEYFKDSKVRDGKGRLKVMYHTTPNANFTVFNPMFSDDKISLFFTDNIEMSRSYDGSSVFELSKAFGFGRTVSVKDNTSIIVDPDNLPGRNIYNFKNTEGFYTRDTEFLNNVLDEYGIEYTFENGKYRIPSFDSSFNDGYYTYTTQFNKEPYELARELEKIQDKNSSKFVNGKLENPYKGTYSSYLNLVNPLEVDANGSKWNEIKYDGETVNTRTLSKIAKTKGFDGVIIKNVLDNGNGASKTEDPSTVAIAFNPNQIKSTTNTNPTSDPDIRYSERDANMKDMQDKVNEFLVEENKKLKADIENLREVIRMQENVIDDRKVTNSSIRKAGAKILENAGINRGSKEFYDMLTDLYKYIADDGNELLESKAEAIADWVIEHRSKKKTTTISEESEEVLDHLKGKRLRVTEEQKKKIESAYGSYNSFRKMLFGTVIITTKEDAPTIESEWQELAELFPAHFNADDNSQDMPEKLLRTVDSLKASKDIEEYVFASELDKQDIILDIYDGYWKAATLRSPASKYQKEVNELKAAHAINVQNIRLEHKLEVKRLKDDFREQFKNAREYYRQKSDEVIQRIRDRQDAMTEKRRTTDVRNKVKRLYKELKDSPWKTKGVTYPEGLVRSVIDICELIDPTGEDQSTKTAKEHWDSMRALQNLRMEYDRMEQAGYEFASEHDKYMSWYIDELSKRVGEKPLRDMNLNEITSVYNVLEEINIALRFATKLLDREEGRSVLDAWEGVIENQKEVQRKGLNKSLKGTQWFNDLIRQWTLNPMRAAYEMTGYDENAELYKLFKDINDGRIKQDFFIMNANKMFESLRETKEGKKSYNDSVEKAIDFGIKDVTGKTVKLSKMQAMQAIMTYERATTNEHQKHLDSPVRFVRVEDAVKGNMGDAFVNGYDVMLTDYVVNKLKNKLESWDKEYMDQAHKLFNEVAKNAINETTLKTKRRIIATDKNYIPYMVNENELNKESEHGNFKASIESSGMLQRLIRDTDTQLVMTGLNDILDEHIKGVGKIYGLSIPVRNWNKIMNLRVKRTLGQKRTTAKDMIANTWHGQKAWKLLSDAVADMQSPRANNTPVAIQALKSAFVTSTLASNISVTMKQFASYPTAGAVLSGTSLMRASYAFGISGNAMKELWNEIDTYTPQHYFRRLGLSVQELGEMSQSNGWQNKLNNRLGMLSPMNWIQAFDVRTTQALWVASKFDAGKKYAKGTKEYYEYAAELYNKTLEETQPMYDALHRAEVTKNSSMQNFVMFMTQPLQNSGILHEATHGLKANIKKHGANSKQAKEAGKKFRKAVVSQCASHLLFTLMTFAGGVMLHRVNPWRDDDKELTWESFISEYGKEFLENYANAILPFANYVFSGIEKIMGKSSYDVFSAPVIDKINGTLDIMNKQYKSVYDQESGEFVDLTDKSNLSKFFDTSLNTVAEVLSYFGIPGANIKKIADSVKLYKQDIENGDLWKFEAGVDRNKSEKLNRIYRFITEGDKESLDKEIKTFKDESAYMSALVESLVNNDNRVTKAAELRDSGKMSDYKKLVKRIVKEGNFTQDEVVKGVNKVINQMHKDDEDGSSGSSKPVAMFNTSDIANAITGDTSELKTIKKELVSEKVAKGKDKEDARKEVISSIKTKADSLLQSDDIKKSTYKKVLTKYCGKSEEDAELLSKYAKYKGKNPDTEMSTTAYSNYLSIVKDTGLSATEYDAYYGDFKDIKGEDKNGDGKTDAYSTMDNQIAYIDSLDLTPAQKTAFFLATGNKGERSKAAMKRIKW